MAFGDYTGWRNIASIEFVERADFYDMWVPGFENYVAEGFVNHNTGQGKGRVAAGMLRYAIRQNMIPVLVTEKPDLYGDMVRDMNDIGMTEMLGHEPNILMTNTGESVPLDEEALAWKQEADQAKAAGEAAPKRRGKFLSGGGKAKSEAGMRSVLERDGKIDMVFTTYDQMNTVKGQDTDRRRFLARIAPDALIVADEAHNAGGQGQGGWKPKAGAPRNRADFARDLATNAKAVVFSSATYAKRPDVMDLYARTDMGKAVDDPKKLPELIQKGGVPMQQIVASMLADAGQYMRRERSFEGVEYAVEGVPVEAKSYKQFSDAIRSVFQFDLAVKDVREEYMQDALDEAGFGRAKDGGVGEGAAHSTAFASVMHNIVNQMLLAIKANQVADRAIAAHKAGEKPVIYLSNTMESFISDFAAHEGLKAGQEINIGFADVLARYLTRTLRFTVKSPDDKKVHIDIPVNKLPTSLQRMYRSALDAINAGDYEGLPVSPIDAMRDRLTKAGLKVAEVTGRHMTIDYSRATPQLASRSKSEMGAAGKRSSIAAFNRGALDALIINRSGSTGVSMHASKSFRDQKRRRMLIAQPDPNIDTHLQALGRVHRTGQVIAPAYSQVAAEIPAEARPTAVLMKKMASLNANTTGARGSVFMADAVDFMNDVGDKVVYEMLREEPEIDAKLGYALKADAEGRTVPEDAARRATGRLVLLDPAEQSDFLDHVTKAYKAEIERLDAIGENALEAKTVDLATKTLDTTVLKERQGEGPFLDETRLEKVSAKAQGRAMKFGDVAKAVAETMKQHVGDGDPAQLLSQLEVKGHEFGREQVEATRKRALAWISSDVAAKSDDAQGSTQERHEEALRRWLSVAQVAYPGARVQLGLSNGPMHGVVLSVARSGKAKSPVALSSWDVTIAVPDSARQFVFPMSKLFGPGQVKSEDEQGATIEASPVRFPDLATQFEEARREGREERYVVTGNILAGYEQVRGKGQIVNFTTDKGELKPGVLMGRDFKVEKFMDSRAIRMVSGAQVAEFLDQAKGVASVGTTDKLVDLQIYRGAYRIDVAASRSTGGRYYTDPAVRSAIGSNEFVKRGNKMVAELTREQFVGAVDAMRKAGALFETTSEQELAQEIVKKAGGMQAAIRSAIPTTEDFQTSMKDRRKWIGDQLRAGRDVPMGRRTIAAVHDAVAPHMQMVPAGVRVFTLSRIPAKLNADGEVLAVYQAADGHEVQVPISWKQISGTRAFHLEGDILFNVFAAPSEGAVADFNRKIAAELGHEITHALRFNGRLAGDRWDRLVSHSKSLRLLDGQFATYLKVVGDPAADGVDGRTTRAAYEKMYVNRDNLQEMMAQEEAAHLVEWYLRGQLSDAEIMPVWDIVSDILTGNLDISAADSEVSSSPPLRSGDRAAAIGGDIMASAIPTNRGGGDSAVKSGTASNVQVSQYRTNAAGFVLRLPFMKEWGDPRFNPTDREAALARLREIQTMPVKDVPWAEIVEARDDIQQITANLFYYSPELSDDERKYAYDSEIYFYAHHLRLEDGDTLPPNLKEAVAKSAVFFRDDLPEGNVADELRDFQVQGKQAVDYLWESGRRGVRDLLIYGGRDAGFGAENRAEPKSYKAYHPNPERIGATMPSGFYFKSGRLLSEVPVALFNQGGEAVINWLRKNGVKRAEIEHFQLLETFGNRNPTTREAFAQAIADRQFDFKRKVSILNPEISKKDYGLGGTRAFRGPRIPGRAIYFEELAAFPQRLKGGDAFAPGYFVSPHWDDQLKGTWASIRGSVRDVPGYGKMVVGEEEQSDFMQGALGNGDAATGRRPRISSAEYLERKIRAPRYEKIMDEAVNHVLDATHYAYRGENHDMSMAMRHDLIPMGDGQEYARDLWQNTLESLRKAVLSRTVALRQDGDPSAYRGEDVLKGLDSLERLRNRNEEFFAPGAKAKFTDPREDYTPASPLDESWVSNMAKSLLIAAARRKADSVAIPTTETNDRIQINTHRSAGHFYDTQFKPRLERELRTITGDHKLTLEIVKLPKAMGQPRNQKAYEVWAVRLSPETRKKILVGLPMMSSVPTAGVSQAERAELAREMQEAIAIVERTAGNVRVVFRDQIRAGDVDMDPEQAAGALTAPTLGGYYQAGNVDGVELIALATQDPSYDLLTSAGHEAYHRAERNFANPAEMRLLGAPTELERLKRTLVAPELGMRAGDARLDSLQPHEVRAIAYGRYRRLREEGGSTNGILIGIRRFWDKLTRILQAVRNVVARRVSLRDAMAGSGSSEAIFEQARTGALKVRGEQMAELTPDLVESYRDMTDEERAAVRARLNMAVTDEATRERIRNRLAEIEFVEENEGADVQGSAVPTPGATGLTYPAREGLISRMLGRIPGGDKVRIALQDRMLPFKRQGEKLERDTGAELPVNLDVYVAESLYHGRAGEQLVDQEAEFVEPLIEALRKADIRADEFGDYLYARHARERNAHIRTINPDLDAGSGMEDGEADAILDSVRKSGKQDAFDKAAEIIDAMTEDARKTLLKAGLIDRERYDTWSSQWANYVSLRGFEVGDGDNHDGIMSGMGFDIHGREARQALGRRSKSDNPLVYAVMQAQQAIVRAEKNRVAKTLWRTVEAHPDASVWKVYRGKWGRRLNPETNRIERYWITPNFTRPENVFGVKIGGKQHWIEVKHEGMARALRGRERGQGDDLVANYVMPLTRTYAQLLTSWNPEFVISNALRDMETALINVSDVKARPAGVRRKIIKDAISLKSIRGIMAALRNRDGNEYTPWFERYRHAGGKISFMEYNDVERIRGSVVNSINAGAMRRAARATFRLVSDLNTSVENGVRLSVFKALVENGVSDERAAFIARELTVNFNRKGELGPLINAFYMFFNASIQGTARIAMAASRSKAVRYAIGGLFMMGMMMDMLNFMGAGDDDDGENYYEKIPEWIKARNMILMIPGRNDYIQIPMGLGYNVPYLAGQQLMAAFRNAAGHGKTTPLKAALTVASNAFDIFNPIGAAPTFGQFLAPTMLDPVIQVGENVSWNGRPIQPTKFERNKPDSENFYSTAPWWAIDTARLLNAATGGNRARSGLVDVSPEAIQHYVEFAGGGVAKFALNAWNTGERTVTGQEWLPEKTPFLRRVYGKATNESRRRDFLEAWSEVDAAHYEVRQLGKMGLVEDAREAQVRYATELKAYGAMRGVQKALGTFRRERDKANLDRSLSSGQRRERLDALTKQENDMIQRSLRQYNQIKKQKRPGEAGPLPPEE